VDTLGSIYGSGEVGAEDFLGVMGLNYQEPGRGAQGVAGWAIFRRKPRGVRPLSCTFFMDTQSRPPSDDFFIVTVVGMVASRVNSAGGARAKSLASGLRCSLLRAHVGSLIHAPAARRRMCSQCWPPSFSSGPWAGGGGKCRTSVLKGFIRGNFSVMRAPEQERDCPPAVARLDAFFDRSVRRWPGLVAVEIPPGRDRPERKTVTYAELDRQASRVTRALVPLVAGEGVVALLLTRDSEWLYAAQLGVLRAGAAYTCIDPAFPDETISEIFADSGAVVVLVDAAGLARLARIPAIKARRLAVADLGDDWVQGPAANPAGVAIEPASLAYVIYTSGTTGRPKGVMIEHRSIANLVASDLAEFRLGPGDRVAQNSSASYDSSVEEIWLALAAGATLVLLDDATVRLGPDLAPWLQRERITVLCPPPTLLRAMGCADPVAALPHLKLVYVGGEALTADVAARWAPGRRLENSYGPTECTVTSMRITINGGDDLPIGRPVPGATAWVLNDALEEVPDGEAGELCHGGIGLARGYHQRPELTAAKFPIHPRLGRIYRTGDLVRRTPAGCYYFYGRIDAQVKLRGYRIELEAIETRLVECAGVREAACAVQGEAARQVLVGLIVPIDPGAPPDMGVLVAALGRHLPSYMVPARIGCIDRLPRLVSGKLDRRALPVLAAPADPAGEVPAEPPRTERERLLEGVFREVFQRTTPVSIHEDFFRDLGGDSLSAAVATSQLRDIPELAAATVRDLYEGRTIAGIAGRIHGPAAARAPAAAGYAPPAPRGRPGIFTVAQTAWIAKDLIVGSAVVYGGTFHGVPALLEAWGLTGLVLLAPAVLLLAAVAYVPLAVLLLVITKRTLIGRYSAGQYPVWSRFHLRHWIVERTARAVPWWLIAGTEFQNMALRALGARLGQRVHLGRGVELHHGGWDLLEIGDDASVGRDATVRLIELEAGQIVIGPIQIGAGATLEVHTGVGPGSRIGAEALLTSGSALMRGEKIPPSAVWTGTPAAPAGQTPAVPRGEGPGCIQSPMTAGFQLVAARGLLLLLLAVPAELLALVVAQLPGVDAAVVLVGWPHSGEAVLAWLALAAFATVVTPLTFATEALACRALGRIRPGVISRWGWAYVRVALKTEIADSASQFLWGTLWWPHWLRAAGMKVGRGCEISSLIDCIPELVEIGDRTFCTDGVYLGGPRVRGGVVTLEKVSLGAGDFIGNGAIIRGGLQLPDDTLLGVGTVAELAALRPGAGWFGHPPFELPRREIVARDEGLTRAPSAVRYASRLCWDTLRWALPAGSALVAAGWSVVLVAAGTTVAWPAMVLVVAPLATLASLAALTGLALLIKWSLIGRVRPSVHPLWSCWASRWDFHCMAWGYYAAPAGELLAGTFWLNGLLRAVGARIGRGVVLSGDFAQGLADPDMLLIEDGATVEGTFQAHTFEDRVLKMDYVTIRKGASVGRSAVLLYGAEIGAASRVAPHSVVMKYERLLPGRAYAGFPTREHP
jgi:non-ribosomal peptide synthetase-like protein